VNYGFLIRNDRCIGCHACSTACKAENEVPLGVHRTWVKNVETGHFPDVRRHFQVTRCNHCAEPPCVEICPTTAMYQRDDGIVEFDPDRCIGCKACMQGCPYDAIHIDPSSGTAAKCHFCAHRIELDLEPACVVVCPEHAIVSGDLDDPSSEISRMLAEHRVTVRKPEQGTDPKLFYVDGDEAALHPSATEPSPTGLAWSDVLERDAVGRVPRASGGDGAGAPGSAGSGGHGAPTPSGPIQFDGGRMAGAMVRTVYDVQHAVPWHWPVPAYLVTKGIAAGLFLLLAAGFFAQILPFDLRTYLWGGFLSLAFTGITTVLLVADLDRPERFLTVLTRPQWRSWLVRGAYLLVAFSAVVGAWWGVEVAALQGSTTAGEAVRALRPWAFGLGAPLALGTAVYTAFLFGQAEGRDLWQSPLLPAHLVVQAAIAGGATLLLADAFLGFAPGVAPMAVATVAGALGLNLVLLLPGEFAMPHASDSAAEAAEAILGGRYRAHFWWGALVLGHGVPLGLLALGRWVGGGSWAHAGAGIAALAGLYLYEHAYIRAGQLPPLS